jgi:hypothetical protein
MSSVFPLKAYVDLVDDVIEKSKHQLEFINRLKYDYNFTLASYENLIERYPEVKINPEHREWQFMLRALSTGEWDTELLVGIRYLGERQDYILIYLNNHYTTQVHLEWEKKKVIHMKEKKLKMKFPNELTYDERADWRSEDEKVRRGTIIKPSAFYLKWAPIIQKMNQDIYQKEADLKKPIYWVIDQLGGEIKLVSKEDSKNRAYTFLGKSSGGGQAEAIEMLERAGYTKEFYSQFQIIA